MKVKVLHTISTIISKDYVSTFNSSRHSIEHVAEPNGYLIDKTTFIPYHNVREVVVEVKPLEPIKLSAVEIEEAKDLSEDKPKKLRKVG